MSTEKTERPNKLHDVLWVSLFILLCVSAVFLAFCYVYMMIEDSVADGGDELKYKLWYAAPDRYRFDTADDFAVLPSMIYFQNENGGAVLYNNESLIREYYADLERYLTLGAVGEPTVFSEDELTRMEKLIRESDCFYIEFPSELPLWLYIYYMSGSIPEEIFEIPEAEYYTDSFFIIKGEGTEYSVAFASEEKIIVFPTNTEAAYPDVLANTLTPSEDTENGSDFISAEFTLSENDISVDPFAISVTGQLYTTDIVSGEKFNITNSPEAVEQTLTLFGYNPDKVSTYRESLYTDVYVAAFGLLKLSPEKISFEGTEGGGIDISDYTMIEGESTVFDILRVSDGFISTVKSFSRELFGGDSTHRLDGITYSDGEFTVSYSYFFENISIQNANAASFTFRDGKLTRAEIFSLNIENSFVRKISERSELLYEIYERNGKLYDDARFELSYRRNDSGLSAEWILY